MSQKDFMGAEDFAPSPTDIIISDYENKISQNIASKTLSASKHGKTPEFTKEELLYLNRKAGEDEDTELKVITPAPLVTLKKGKTELNIGHAVKLVQKMEEKYPTGVSIDDQVKMFNRPFVKENTLPPYYEEQVDYAMQQIQKEEPLKTGEQSIKDAIDSFEALTKTIQQPIKTVNKNAYEIREAVLAHALSWVQYVHECNRSSSNLTSPPNEDCVLNIAQKFYNFVENRR